MRYAPTMELDFVQGTQSRANAMSRESRRDWLSVEIKSHQNDGIRRDWLSVEKQNTKMTGIP